MKLRWFTLCALALLGGACGMTLMAEDIPVALCAQTLHNIQMAAGSTGFTDHLWVSKSQSMHVAVLLPVGDFNLSLASPSGQLIPWDAASTLASCTQVAAQSDPQGPVLANAYHFTVGSPANGSWTIKAQTSVPLATDWVSGMVSADFDSDINAGVFMLTHKTFVGQSLTASLAVVDGSTQLTNFQYDAKLLRGGDLVSSAQSITFSSVPSSSGGDPTLVATFLPSQSGSFNLLVKITGTTSAGSFERTVATGFIVYPQKAKITGTFTQRQEISCPDPAL